MERQQEFNETEEIDLKKYVEVLLKWKWMIVLFTIGCLLTSYIVSSFLITPVYETKAILMATQPDAERTYRQEDGSLESTVDSFSRPLTLNLNTFTAQFKNTEILTNVIKKLHLEETEDPNEIGYTPRTLANAITVTGDEETSLIEIKVLNTDPELAKSITNTLVDEFYAFLFSSNQKQMKEAVAYLATQLEQTEKELLNVSETFQQGKAQARNSSILEKELISKTETLTSSKTILMQSQVELEQAIAGRLRLEENLANTPAKLVTTKSWSDSESMPDNLEEFDLNEENSSNNNLTSEEINPLYLELVKDLNLKDSEIAQTKAKIAGVTNIISVLEEEIAAIQVELSAKQLEESTVKRKLDSLENAYAVLNTKIIETEIAKSADFGRMGLTLVSPAYEPTKLSRIKH